MGLRTCVPGQRKCVPDVCQGIFPCREGVFELQILHGFKDLLEDRSGRIADFDQIMACDERRRRGRLILQFLQLLFAERVAFQVAMAA